MQNPNEDNTPVVCALELTAVELAHIRDLMSILLPPSGTRTMSQELAINESRPYVDSLLFKKVFAACDAAGVPTGCAAPDFGLTLAEMPAIAVMRIQAQLSDESGANKSA